MEGENTNGKTLSIVTNRMFSALNSFYIWKILNQSMNVNEESEEKAKENLEWIFNKYPNFFQQTIINAYKTFVVDLAIFFDSEGFEQTLSLGKLLKLLDGKNIDIEKLKLDINQIKKPHGKLISLIMDLRNQDVAHQAMDPVQHTLNYEEVENLFKAVHKILNNITKYYDDSITMWNHIEDNVKNDINWIFGNLKRGEKVRLEEISLKWK